MASYQHLIEVAQLKDVNAAGACRVVDCRFDLLHPDKGWAQYVQGHIPGAVYAHLDRDLAGPVSAVSGRHPLPAVGVFQATLERWGIGTDTQLVVYDQSNGALAARLWWLSRWFGHSRVAVLNGGLDAWCAAGGSLETAVPQYAATKISGSPDAGKVMATGVVATALGNDRQMHLVDARDRARFAGEREPIDTVAGHVPGALNFPFAENVNDDGTWKAPHELRLAWDRVLGTEASIPVTVMCGSGVTACHLVLSAVIAGIDEPRVYVGSWSEWIRDDSRPVATSA